MRALLHRWWRRRRGRLFLAITCVFAVVLFIYDDRIRDYNSLNGLPRLLNQRYMVAIDRPGPMVSPFTISIEDTKGSRVPRLNTLKSPGDRLEFFNSSFKFVFTRDPFWRLFSTYIDKVFSPNPYYWGDWSQKAVKLFHLNQGKHPCGSGISFENLLRYVVQVLRYLDMHFIPMHKMCRLCDGNYDLVGKAEYSVHDIDYLASKLNVSSSFQHDDDYRLSTADDIINDSTSDVFHSWIRTIKRCIGAFQMGKIIWRRLQIRGVIDRDIKFPFSKQEMEVMNINKFRQGCKKAARESTDVAKLKRQKLEAFVEAYKTVDFEVLRRVQEAYKLDFQLLGYNGVPDLIFKANRSSINRNILDWNKEWR